MKFAVAILTLLTALAAVPAHAQSAQGPSQEYNGEFVRRPDRSAATDRIIVKWRNPEQRAAGTDAKATEGSIRARKASAASGVALQKLQSLTSDIEVMKSTQTLSGAALDEVVQRLQADPEVEYASPDLVKHAHALTSDPQLPSQWYLLGDQPASTRTTLAWEITQGSSSIVVAVLDTGVRFDHPDLGRASAGGKLLDGYDFVSDPRFANDGDGRDADASDPGDFVSTADLQTAGFANCELSQSSWHGTRVSGLIGALTNNGIGVAGGAWNTLVLPLRVLGKCGGFDSDIIAAMRWAAGLAVSGVPANPTPAKIINLSLGGDGACSAAYQSAVSEITASGALVVVSVGNEGGPVASPANCSGALGVTGLRHIGTKVGFSNVGTTAGLGAPGGNCVNTGAGQPCVFSIVVATNTGTTAPVAPTYTDQFNFNVGTSFSAPLVAASAALMKSVNSRLSPAQLVKLLKRSATPFPVNSDSSIPACHLPVSSNDLQTAECNCTTTTCGAGMLNTNAAVDAAQRPFAQLSASGSVTVGANVTLDASGSFAADNRSVTNYEWSIINLTGTAPVIAAPAQPMTTLQIAGNSSFTLRLTVTDDQGGQSTDDLALSTPTAPPTPPSTPNTPTVPLPSGGGGGGALGWEMLGLALLTCLRRRNRGLKGFH